MCSGPSRGPVSRGMRVRRGLVLVLVLVALAAASFGGWAGGSASDPSASAATPRKAAPALARFASCSGFLAHVRGRALALSTRGRAGGPAVGILAPGAPEADRAAVAAPATAGGRRLLGHERPGGRRQRARHRQDRRAHDLQPGGRLGAGRGRDRRRAAPGTGLTLDDVAPSGLLLLGDRLLVLGESGSPVVGDAPVARAQDLVAWPVGDPTTVLVQLDVSDPSRPRVLSRMTVDGRLVAARRTGGTVACVVASTPDPVALAPRTAARSSVGAWLPRLTVRDAATRRTVRRAAVPCRSVSRPAQFAGVGMVSVLTVAAAGHADAARLRRHPHRRRAGLRVADGHVRRHRPMGRSRPRERRDAAARDDARPQARHLRPRAHDLPGERGRARLPAQPVLALRARGPPARREHRGARLVGSARRAGARERERRHRARRERRAARAGRPGRRPRPRRAHLRGALPRRPRLRRHLPPDRPPVHARPLRPGPPGGARRAEDPRLLVVPAPGRRDDR